MSNATAITVAADHPALDGHFPGDPILPGVVILAEVMAAIERSGRTFDAATIAVTKFHAPARPGDRLQIALADRAGAIDFVVTAAERRIATGRIDVGGMAP